MLLHDGAKEVLRKQMWKTADFCGVEILTYCLMSNHFHILVRVPEKELADSETDDVELLQRFTRLYGELDPRTHALAVLLQKEGEPHEREAEIVRRQLLARMHGVSVFMKELKQRFTIWYNHQHERFGTIWAERFKSLIVEEDRGGFAALTVAAYIDLNPVRAGICRDPKDYRFCGYGAAVVGWKAARRGIQSVVGDSKWRSAGSTYRIRLFGSGSWARGTEKAGLDPARFKEIFEQGGKLSAVEILHCRVRYFSDGLVLGSEGFVQDCFEEFRDHFGKLRRSGPRRLKGADWNDLTVIRDLRKSVISS